MDVRIVACMPCYTRRRTALRLAKAIKEKLDLDVPVESGTHGQLDVLINGEILLYPAYLINEDKHFPALAQLVMDELRKRAVQPWSA
jgi:hypothetical protein